jgi:hypothetical protein
MRIIERGVSEKEVEKAISKGTKRVSADKIISAYSYFEVVYKKINKEIYVITVQLRW